MEQAKEWYRDWLDYHLVDEGSVPEAWALSWGAPASAGRRYAVLGPATGEDVFVRAVEIERVPDFQTLTSHGWAAIEMTVADVDVVLKKLERSPFRVIGLPRAVTSGSPIRAMQMVGPAEEVIYLTGNTGDRLASNHPEPQTLIDRVFIMVLAGPDIGILKKFYLENFKLDDQGQLSFPIQVLSDAQGLPADHKYKLSVLVASERGNKLELDEYESQFGERPGPPDQLPPGVAMATFEADSFRGLDIDFVTSPAPLYEGYVAATFFGPAGERTEIMVRER